MANTVMFRFSCIVGLICGALLLTFSVSAGNEVDQFDLEDRTADRRKRTVEACGEVHSGRLEYPRDCQEVFEGCGTLTSGVYLIQPEGSLTPFQVYCNDSIDGGDWTVFQRREDGSVDFYRNWAEYRNGFGFLSGEFWLGNDKLALLTNQKAYSLRIDVVDLHGASYSAKYQHFRIGDENSKYRLLNIDGYFSSSMGGDQFGWYKNKNFSTYDRDNDGWGDYNCAERHMGAWWFAYNDVSVTSSCVSDHDYCERFPNDAGNGCVECGDAHFNGVFGTSDVGINIFWDGLSGSSNDCGIRYTEMKIRPLS